MKKGEVVKDDEGNHFIVLKPGRVDAWVESVATRETFLIPNHELSATDRVTF